MAKSPILIWQDGPVSQPYQPPKSDIREYMLWLQGQVDPSGSGTGVDFAADLAAHINDQDNPHHVTADQLGLGDINERIGVNVPLYGDRPGDSPHNFVDVLTGGDPISIPEIETGSRAVDENGRVRRVTGAAIVASRALYPLEPNKVYLVEFVIQRRVDTPDPSNDAVRCALAWYNQGLGVLTPAFTVIRDITTLVVGDGRVVITATVSRAAGNGIDIVSPANARYARPYCQSYGTFTVTDFEVTRWVDITNATTYSPDLTALEGRVSSIESLGLGPRVSALEGQITAPNILRLSTRADISATDVPITVDILQTLSNSTVSDIGGSYWYRVPSSVMNPGGEQSLDGAYWQMLSTENGINVRQLGAKGDWDPITSTGTDDTTAIMDAYNTAIAIARGRLHFPPGIYAISSLEWSGSGFDITFDRAKLYGTSTTAVDQILNLKNFRQSRIYDLEIETDGDKTTPTFHGNYGCALRLSTDNADAPTQYDNIDGLTIRYCRNGVVNGNLLGSAPQPSFAQSEITIARYKQRGVQRPFYGNAINGYLAFIGNVFTPNQYEASAAAWDASGIFNIRNDAGQIVSIGDEFQRSESGGYNIYGKDMKILGPIWEAPVNNYITGDVTIAHTINGYFGSAVDDCFVVDPAAVGTLRLQDVYIRRPDNVASTSNKLLVNAKGNNAFKIDIQHSKIKDWRFVNVNESAHLILGGELRINGLEIDNSASTAASYFFDEKSNVFTTFDPTGASMSTTSDRTTKGGWSSSSTGGGFAGYTTDVPSGYSSAIRFIGDGTNALNVVTPSGASGSRVTGNKNYLFECWLKRIGTVTGSFQIQIIEYNFAGTQIGSAKTIFSHDGARMDTNGFNVWQRLRSPYAAHADACFIRVGILLSAAGGDAAISGLKMF